MANYGGYDWDKAFAEVLAKHDDEVVAERDPDFLELIDQWRAEFPAEPA